MTPEASERLAGSAVAISAKRVVYLVDDDEGLRHSLEFLLDTRRIATSLFASGMEFFDALPTLPPAPIILDIRMPSMDGLRFLAKLAESDIDWPVIVLSGHGEVNVAVRAIKLGAIDFLEKPVAAAELERTVERAFFGMHAQQERGNSRRGAVQLIGSLTSREAEVLEGLCKGLSNKQVAFELSISPRTVEMHRANALRHLGIRSIAEVVSLKGLAQTPADRAQPLF